jgi:hypothetical protein
VESLLSLARGTRGAVRGEGGVGRGGVVVMDGMSSAEDGYKTFHYEAC